MEFTIHVLIKNGTIVNADGQVKQDLLVESGVVRRLDNNTSPQLLYEEIGATGCYVFPGGMDVHMHFDIDVGIARSCDDLLTGTRAAACDGTTTIIDHMGFDPNGCRLHHQLEVYRDYAAHKVVIDCGFHGVIQHIDHTILDRIPMIVEEGLSNSKFYLTYQYRLNDDEVLQALCRLHKPDAPTIVHPEDDAAIANKRAEFIAVGLTTPRYHALGRPLECETEAIVHMINLIQVISNTPLYIVHLSNGLGLDYLRSTRANHQPVRVEACSQYLLLDERSYDAEGGMEFVLSPPLRSIHEQGKLWCGTSDGVTDAVATDHCTFSMAQRLQISRGDFSRRPDDLPDVESRTQLLFFSGVMTGRITPERFVKLTSAIPVRSFGLWPQKGSLAPDSDGDVVIIDPHQSQQIQHRRLHDNTDYSPWEGFTCQDVIVRTLFRGGMIFCDGTFTGKAGRGRFLRRKPFVPPAFQPLPGIYTQSRMISEEK